MNSAWAQPFDDLYETGDLTFDDEALTRQTTKYAPDTLVRASEVTFAWMDRAACLGLDPDAFFPSRGEPARTARKVCGGCPVSQQCLDLANSTAASGIWGGTTEMQRKRDKAA
jgi:WhiB family redox-sensing transcriptional regulator